MVALYLLKMEFTSRNSTFKSGKLSDFLFWNSSLIMNVVTSFDWIDPNFSLITFSDKNLPIVFEIIWKRKGSMIESFETNPVRICLAFFGLRLSVMIMRLVEVLGELFNRVESMWSRWKTYLDHNGRMKWWIKNRHHYHQWHVISPWLNGFTPRSKDGGKMDSWVVRIDLRSGL